MSLIKIIMEDNSEIYCDNTYEYLYSKFNKDFLLINQITFYDKTYIVTVESINVNEILEIKKLVE